MEVNGGDDGSVVLPGHMHVGAKRADDREMHRNLTSGKKRGATRTVTMVVPSENKEDINRIVKKRHQ